MKSEITRWIWNRALWIAIPLLVASVFVALIASGIVLPLLLFVIGLGLLSFRYWTEIKAFDLWAFDEWASAKIDTFGIREWHTPYHAAEYFCDPQIVRARNEAAAEANTIMMELIRDQNRNVIPDGERPLPHPDYQRSGPSRKATGRNADHDAAQAWHDEHNRALGGELHQQLLAGTLIAKGLPVRNEETLSEQIIPTSRWRILGLSVSKAEAAGQGLHYIGIVIGKKPEASAPVPQKKPRRVRK